MGLATGGYDPNTAPAVGPLYPGGTAAGNVDPTQAINGSQFAQSQAGGTLAQTANPFAGWGGQNTAGNLSPDPVPSVFSPAGYSNMAAPEAAGNVAQPWATPTAPVAAGPLPPMGGAPRQGGYAFGQNTGWTPGQGSPFTQLGMTPGGQGNVNPGATAISPGVGMRPGAGQNPFAGWGGQQAMPMRPPMPAQASNPFAGWGGQQTAGGPPLPARPVPMPPPTPPPLNAQAPGGLQAQWPAWLQQMLQQVGGQGGMR